jgi:hypothetical protein
MGQAPEPGRSDVRLYRCSVRISIISLLASCLPIGIPKQNYYAKTVSRYAAESRFCGEMEMNRF